MPILGLTCACAQVSLSDGDATNNCTSREYIISSKFLVITQNSMEPKIKMFKNLNSKHRKYLSKDTRHMMKGMSRQRHSKPKSN